MRRAYRRHTARLRREEIEYVHHQGSAARIILQRSARTIYSCATLIRRRLAMRVLTLFTGMLIGAGATIWFYSNGGEISVFGQQWGPAPKAASAEAGADPGLGKSKAPAKP